MHNIINNLFINSGILYFHDINIFYNQDLRISQTSIDLKKNVVIKFFVFQQGMVTQSPIPTKKTESQVNILWKILL